MFVKPPKEKITRVHELHHQTKKMKNPILRKRRKKI
jgi:hypothetical protein